MRTPDRGTHGRKKHEGALGVGGLINRMINAWMWAWPRAGEGLIVPATLTAIRFRAALPPVVGTAARPRRKLVADSSEDV